MGFGTDAGGALIAISPFSTPGMTVKNPEGVAVTTTDEFGIVTKFLDAETLGALIISAGDIFANKVTANILDPLVVESFPVSPAETYEPGDVLVIDPQGSGQARLCYRANDTGVLGVVAPGATVDGNGEILVVILGAHGPIWADGSRLSGYVKADASFGAIQAGDLLTTSPTSGYAMVAAEPKIGSIFGKALQPLAEGQGLIKVFVTLH